jgi:hypothetical protein
MRKKSANRVREVHPSRAVANDDVVRLVHCAMDHGINFIYTPTSMRKRRPAGLFESPGGADEPLEF